MKKIIIILPFTLFLVFSCSENTITPKNTTQIKNSVLNLVKQSPTIQPRAMIKKKEEAIIILFDTALTEDSNTLLKKSPRKRYILKDSYDRLNSEDKNKYKEYKILDINNLPSENEFGYGDGDLKKLAFGIAINPTNSFDSNILKQEKMYISSYEMGVSYINRLVFNEMYNKTLKNYFYFASGIEPQVLLGINTFGNTNEFSNLYKRLEYINQDLLTNKVCKFTWDSVYLVEQKSEPSRFFDLEKPIKTIVFSSLLGANFISIASDIFEKYNENFCFITPEILPDDT